MQKAEKGLEIMKKLVLIDGKSVFYRGYYAMGALSLSARELSGLDEKECAVVRPWLQDFTATWVDGHISYGYEEVQSQIQAVYDAGYNEWILWNAKNNYSIGIEEETPEDEIKEEE